ncbi:MAG: DUF1257 domain-containing protein [Deltaproteobacteria bacterium]|nr:DUF1257 domain-containing protein [Deltaproteobacteria bacterium]
MSLSKAGYRYHDGGSCYYGPLNPYKNADFSASREGERIAFKRVSDDAGYDIIVDSELISRKRQDIVDEITQAYSQEKIMKLARARGFSVLTNRTNARGQIEMVLRKVA